MEEIKVNTTACGAKEDDPSTRKLFDSVPGDASDDETEKAPLDEDNKNRPVWIDKNYHIFLETSSPLYKDAYKFLMAIAEPIKRLKDVHEYKLTQYSLYAAIYSGLQTNDILQKLKHFSKTTIPQYIKIFIKLNTSSCGKIKLVLKDKQYFIKSTNNEILKKFIKDADIARCLIMSESDNMDSKTVSDSNENLISQDLIDFFKELSELKNEDSGEEEEEEVSYKVNEEKIIDLQKRAMELKSPLLIGYNFSHDKCNPNIKIDLKKSVILRPYQLECMYSFFHYGCARSGVIVLPCGAGKSLVGVAAVCTIGKPALVLCNSAVSVEQWKEQFLFNSTINRNQICCFTSDLKDPIICCDVFITTYSMITHTQTRTEEAESAIDWLKSKEWGIMILDEVHTVPANMFRRVLTTVKSHCKLGLTATLLREDDKVDDINFLIGPKLYDANWLELQEGGYIATVKCAEIRCKMSEEFYEAYVNGDLRKKLLLQALNPSKFRNCEYIIKHHEKNGDKIIVFSDNVYALKHYAQKLNRPFIYGPTSQEQRIKTINRFKYFENVKTIFVSKVADTSFDIPQANVLIQISSHGASRRQEVQRLGRILRSKKGSVNAYFYTLITEDALEMDYSTKRHSFLLNQGYAYKVLNELAGMNEDNKLMYGTREQQLELLNEVLKATTKNIEEESESEETKGSDGSSGKVRNKLKRKKIEHIHPLFKAFRK